MFFIARKGFVYTICGGYLCFSPRILHHFTLHLAPKRTAFSIKTHYILLQIAKKRVLVAVGLNKNSFCLHAQLAPFCIKTNLRNNRFFAARWAIVGENCTHNVKFLTKNKTK